MNNILQYSFSQSPVVNPTPNEEYLLDNGVDPSSRAAQTCRIYSKKLFWRLNNLLGHIIFLHRLPPSQYSGLEILQWKNLQAHKPKPIYVARLYVIQAYNPLNANRIYYISLISFFIFSSALYHVNYSIAWAIIQRNLLYFSQDLRRY